MDDSRQSDILEALAAARRLLRNGDLRGAERTAREAIRLRHESAGSVANQRSAAKTNTCNGDRGSR